MTIARASASNSKGRDAEARLSEKERRTYEDSLQNKTINHSHRAGTYCRGDMVPATAISGMPAHRR